MWYVEENGVIKLSVYVQPGAKKTEIVGIYDEALKIRLKAPPLEGRANLALQQYLAQLFAVPLKQVQLTHGEKTRRKQVDVRGSKVSVETLWNK